MSVKIGDLPGALARSRSAAYIGAMNDLAPSELPGIASRIRTAYDRAQASREAWIDATLDLAAAIAEGRAHFSADQEFGRWLVDQELNMLSRDDRAALIMLGRDIERTRVALQVTDSRSWRLIAQQSAEPSRPRSVIAPAAQSVSQAAKPDDAERAETTAETEAVNREAEDVLRRRPPPPPPPLPPPTPRQKTGATIRAALRTAVDPTANQHEAEAALKTVQRLDPRLETIDKRGEDFPLVATLVDQSNGYYDEMMQLRETVGKLKEANEKLTARNREQREIIRQAVPVPPLEYLPELDITIERGGMDPVQFVVPAGTDAAGALKLMVEKLALYVIATQEEVEADAAAENDPGTPHASRSTTDAAL